MRGTWPLWSMINLQDGVTMTDESFKKAAELHEKIKELSECLTQIDRVDEKSKGRALLKRSIKSRIRFIGVGWIGSTEREVPVPDDIFDVVREAVVKHKAALEKELEAL